MIHRDLKLGNIFLDENQNVKLGDFGLATTTQKKREDIEKNKKEDDKAKKSVI